jgi:ATP-dependent Clp protease ATP-binding subunit ClpC
MSSPPEVKELDEQILAARRRKEAAIDAQDFNLAQSERDAEMSLTKQKEERERSWKSGDRGEAIVDEDLIAEVLAQSTGIPVFKLTEEES